MRTIVEDLNYAAQEPSSRASAQAQRLGLSYAGFGRYEDPRTKQITHIVQNDQLVPFKKAIKTNTYKTQQSDDIGNFVSALSPEAQEIDQILSQSYPPQNYDDNEITAIQQFTTQSYDDVNTVLSKLPAGVTPKQIQPISADDTTATIIAALDSAMKKSRSPIDFITYTKLDDSVKQMDLVPGTQFKFKGFRNTTVSLANIMAADDGTDSSTVLQIRVKKNARGIYTSNYSETPEDAEFVLPRGAKIEVVSGPTKLVGSDAQVSALHREFYYYDCITKS